MTRVSLQRSVYDRDRRLWDTLLSQDRFQHPFGFPHDQEYMKAYAPAERTDRSVLALVNEKPVAGLQITSRVTEHGTALDFYGRPAMLRVSANDDPAVIKEAEEMLAEHLIEVVADLDRPSLQFMEIPDGNQLSTFAAWLVTEGCPSMPLYKQIIDLSLDETEMRSDVRRRYKSHINYGEKNMAIGVVDQSSITSTAINEFRSLHVGVAGRETRPRATWEIQEQMIRDGQGFLVTGRIDGALVTAALFMHTSKYCYYGVGASIREMFDKPLSHAIIWRGILEAKKRGCLLFDLGDLVDLYPSGYSAKEKSIADFKRGFGGVPKIHLMLSCPKTNAFNDE